MKSFIETLGELKESSYKDEEKTFPNVSKVEKLSESSEGELFLDLISTCGKITDKEIEEYIRNVDNHRENKKSRETLRELHEELHNQALDDEEDFI